jgi:hypothetical protein
VILFKPKSVPSPVDTTVILSTLFRESAHIP